MIPKEIDGAPMTKPYGLRERSYIKGWEARQGEIKKYKKALGLIKGFRHWLKGAGGMDIYKIAKQALTGKEQKDGRSDAYLTSVYWFCNCFCTNIKAL